MSALGRAFVTAAVLACTGVMAPAALAAGTVVVRQDALQGWAHSSQLGSSHAFMTGPGTPPLGAGSLQMTVGAGSGAGPGTGSYERFYHAAENGIPIGALSALRYATYQSPSSPASPELLPELRFGVDVDGNGTWDTTLFFRPAHNESPGSFTKGQWVTWDTLEGRWLSEPPIPGDPVCPFGCFDSWSTIAQGWPHARIIHAEGLPGIQVVAGGDDHSRSANWGGWDGNVDAITIGVGDDVTTYDLEPGTTAPPPPAGRACPLIDATVIVNGRVVRVCI